ncbi:hypothetical protein IY145_10880 [Methylosinus sp. H3A]|uniref:hypothetical protein n=1 Tax=Methylosinus sp. H3A TaxID=2785786 RepID=UPI0018C206CE|nr:hypothetical protein [Methylosinus sp. H3A]MBG0809883.1 hypothetical protein [Methylosinus sp. H3A]
MSASVTMRDIITGCATHYAVEPGLLSSHRRDHLVLSARMLAFWFGASLARLTFAEVGEALGWDEHRAQTCFATVEARRRSPAFREMMDGVETAILAIARLRELGMNPRAPSLDPRSIAERILAGGERAAGMASIHEIHALCQAVLAADDARPTFEPQLESAHG